MQQVREAPTRRSLWVPPLDNKRTFGTHPRRRKLIPQFSVLSVSLLVVGCRGLWGQQSGRTKRQILRGAQGKLATGGSLSRTPRPLRKQSKHIAHLGQIWSLPQPLPNSSSKLDTSSCLRHCLLPSSSVCVRFISLVRVLLGSMLQTPPCFKALSRNLSCLERYSIVDCVNA